mmetsp:Transcript_66704/g.198496  ORF Transcript_66704/g.198496 Transcript_66704/m.198496 type:complete len:219 (+) Transcript_66704:625-1281(+)
MRKRDQVAARLVHGRELESQGTEDEAEASGGSGEVHPLQDRELVLLEEPLAQHHGHGLEGLGAEHEHHTVNGGVQLPRHLDQGADDYRRDTPHGGPRRQPHARCPHDEENDERGERLEHLDEPKAQVEVHGVARGHREGLHEANRASNPEPRKPGHHPPRLLTDLPEAQEHRDAAEDGRAHKAQTAEGDRVTEVQGVHDVLVQHHECRAYDHEDAAGQ